MSQNLENTTKQTFVPTIVKLRGPLAEEGWQNKINILSDRLSRYKRGSPDEPGEGFENFRTLPIDTSFQNEDLSNSIPSALGAFRYRSEEYQEDLVYLHGDFYDGHVVKFDLVDVFWLEPIVVFQGNRDSIDSVIRGVQRELMEEINLERIKLEPGIFYKTEATEPSNGLRFGESMSLSAEGISRDVDQVRLTGDIEGDEFAEHGKIRHIFKRFEFYDYTILAHITEEAISIQSISSDWEIGQEEFLMVSLSFIREIIDFHQPVSKQGVIE